MGENGLSSWKNTANQVETVSTADDPSKLKTYWSSSFKCKYISRCGSSYLTWQDMFSIRQLTSPHQNMSNTVCKKAADLATWPRQLGSINKQETVDLPVSVGNSMSPNISLQIPIPQFAIVNTSIHTLFPFSAAVAYHGHTYYICNSSSTDGTTEFHGRWQ